MNSITACLASALVAKSDSATALSWQLPARLQEIIPGLYAASHVAGGDAGTGTPCCGMGDQIGQMYESGMNIAKAILGEEWVLI